ncbi:MAG: DUF6446 family protein, partial [Pseudomonadota bacterium]
PTAPTGGGYTPTRGREPPSALGSAMSGKIISVLLALVTLAVGGGVYYAQVYGFYYDVAEAEVRLTSLASTAPEPIEIESFEAIDADSSPIRYRACFTTPTPLTTLSETFEVFEDAEPLTAPGWFDCFDAEAIGAAIRAGEAVAFTGTRNLEYGIDRVVAVTASGQGFVWHQVNECGDKLYDGTPAGENCPERN